jgi:hypothetical protein
MAVISTRVHGAGDYATGVGLLAAPTLLRIDDGLAAGALRGAGGAILGLSALSDHELGLLRKVPMPVHLIVDAAAGGLLAAGAFGLRRRGGGVASWLPHAVVGVAQVGVAALTARRPGDQGPAAAGGGDVDATAAGGESATATAARGDSATATAAGSDNPTATAAGGHNSTETAIDPPRRPVPADDSLDPLVAREEAAAAAAAASIGGIGPSGAGDPAMDPVYQAGGGEQEGWEEAEALLVENATHGEGYADPEGDAFAPEAETDRSTAVYGEPDSIRSTEVAGERQADAQENPPAGPDTPPNPAR